MGSAFSESSSSLASCAEPSGVASLPATLDAEASLSRTVVVAASAAAAERSRSGAPITTGGSMGFVSSSVLMRRVSSPSSSTCPMTSGRSSRARPAAGASLSFRGSGAFLETGAAVGAGSGGSSAASRFVGVPVTVVSAGRLSSLVVETGSDRFSSSESYRSRSLPRMSPASSAASACARATWPSSIRRFTSRASSMMRSAKAWLSPGGKKTPAPAGMSSRVTGRSAAMMGRPAAQYSDTFASGPP
ncbi:hypothetical protein MYXA107069_36135 [Myxococcus xanthus]